jgi:hypothetical protein
MDALLLADRLPKLAERAMRSAILAAAFSRARGDQRRVTYRALIDDALVRFERASLRIGSDGIRPALLFAERDRIVAELRRFLESRLASRLFAVRRRDIVALGRDAAPFDASVRGRRGGIYGVVFRRLARDGRRLEAMRAIRAAASGSSELQLQGVLVYDFASGSVRTLRCGERPVELSAA